MPHTGPGEPDAEQLVTQPPQWAGSLLVSTQAPLQKVRPAGQETMQAPAWQTSPPGQALVLPASSGAPQLLRSVWRFTHWLLPAGAAEMNFQTSAPSAIDAPVPVGAPPPVEVPAAIAR